MTIIIVNIIDKINKDIEKFYTDYNAYNPPSTQDTLKKDLTTIDDDFISLQKAIGTGVTGGNLSTYVSTVKTLLTDCNKILVDLYKLLQVEYNDFNLQKLITDINTFNTDYKLVLDVLISTVNIGQTSYNLCDDQTISNDYQYTISISKYIDYNFTGVLKYNNAAYKNAANKSTTASVYADAYAEAYAYAVGYAASYAASGSVTYSQIAAYSGALYPKAYAFAYANAYAFAFGYSSVSSANLNNYALFIQSNIVTIMPFMVALMNGTILSNNSKLLSIDNDINNTNVGGTLDQAAGGTPDTGNKPSPNPATGDLTITTVPCPIVPIDKKGDTGKLYVGTVNFTNNTSNPIGSMTNIGFTEFTYGVTGLNFVYSNSNYTLSVPAVNGSLNSITSNSLFASNIYIPAKSTLTYPVYVNNINSLVDNTYTTTLSSVTTSPTYSTTLNLTKNFSFTISSATNSCVLVEPTLPAYSPWSQFYGNPVNPIYVGYLKVTNNDPSLNIAQVSIHFSLSDSNITKVAWDLTSNSSTPMPITSDTAFDFSLIHNNNSKIYLFITVNSTIPLGNYCISATSLTAYASGGGVIGQNPVYFNLSSPGQIKVSTI